MKNFNIISKEEIIKMELRLKNLPILFKTGSNKNKKKYSRKNKHKRNEKIFD